MGPFRAFLEDMKFLKAVTVVADEEDDEILEDWKIRHTELLRQMMFVSGETAEPSADTTGMIEEIVRQQVIEMVSLSPSFEVSC